MFVLTLIFYFKSKSKRNPVAKVATKPQFLVAKEKMLVALATILVDRNFELSIRLHSLCIQWGLLGVGGGGRGYFLNWQNFLRSPSYHTEYFHYSPLLTKRKNWHPTVVVVNVYRLKSNQLYNKNTWLL